MLGMSSEGKFHKEFISFPFSPKHTSMSKTFVVYFITILQPLFYESIDYTFDMEVPITYGEGLPVPE